jgi:hypothetical protein
MNDAENERVILMKKYLIEERDRRYKNKLVTAPVRICLPIFRSKGVTSDRAATVKNQVSVLIRRLGQRTLPLATSEQTIRFSIRLVICPCFPWIGKEVTPAGEVIN